MNRLKKVAAELAGMGQNDLAREVALASLEAKGRQAGTTRTAAYLNLPDQQAELCYRWNGEVADLLAKKLGWKPDHSERDFYVSFGAGNSFQYIKGNLKGLEVTVQGEVNGKPVRSKFQATSSDGAARQVLWLLEDTGVVVTARTREASVDSLQRKVDALADAIQNTITDLKRYGPDAAQQNKLERLQAEWARNIKALDEAIQLEMDSVPFDDDAAWEAF